MIWHSVCFTPSGDLTSRQLETAVLRITRYANNACSPILKVEGRIIADWVMVLKQAIDAEFQSNSSLELDFADVTFIDEAGIRMLCGLPHHNLLITHCAGFIQVLLEQKPALVENLGFQYSNILGIPE